jgi:hypothetical protein
MNLVKAWISILVVKQKIGLNTDLIVVRKEIERMFFETATLNDIEDSLIELRYDNEVEKNEVVLEYLENK